MASTLVKHLVASNRLIQRIECHHKLDRRIHATCLFKQYLGLPDKTWPSCQHGAGAVWCLLQLTLNLHVFLLGIFSLKLMEQLLKEFGRLKLAESFDWIPTSSYPIGTVIMYNTHVSWNISGFREKFSIQWLLVLLHWHDVVLGKIPQSLWYSKCMAQYPGRTVVVHNFNLIQVEMKWETWWNIRSMSEAASSNYIL